MKKVRVEHTVRQVQREDDTAVLISQTLYFPSCLDRKPVTRLEKGERTLVPPGLRTICYNEMGCSVTHCLSSLFKVSRVQPGHGTDANATMFQTLGHPLLFGKS